jgi:hypothetical protein
MPNNMVLQYYLFLDFNSAHNQCQIEFIKILIFIGLDGVFIAGISPNWKISARFIRSGVKRGYLA